MKYYKTKSNWPEAKIYEVEVERESKDSVWINGRRNAKVSTYDCYFPTWDECYMFLLGKGESRLRAAKERLADAENLLAEIKKLA